MAVEIKELHLKFNVEGQVESESETSLPSSSGAGCGGGKVNKEKIVQTCVEQVLRILEEKEENR
jgi:hypothetical protein